MPMLDYRYEGDLLIVRCLCKKIDAAAVGAFRAEMKPLLERETSRIVLNLDNVDFIDSSGLGALISVYKHVGQNGSFTICGVRGSVRSMFRLTRMDKVFQITETESQAILKGVA